MADWKTDLGDFFNKQTEKAKAGDTAQRETKSLVAEFFAREVATAFTELQSELEKHGREVSTHVGEDSATIIVNFKGNQEFDFSVKSSGSRLYPETRFREKTDGKMYKSEGMFGHSSDKSDISHVTKDVIISHFLEDYKRTDIVA